MKVLVTGANGTVGKATCRALQVHGYSVFPAVRQAVSANELPVGDINGETSWAIALERLPDAVVHLAARVHIMDAEWASALQQYREVNTEGTLNLARQCAAAGVQRFVFVSTVKVLGEESSVPLQDTDPLQPDGAYAESKCLAEQGLWQIASETGMEVVVIRPPLVYGPAVKGNFSSMLCAIDRGIPLPLRSVRNSRSLVYVGNLVSAIQICLSHPAAAGKAWLVSDVDDVSTPELLRRVGAALNRPVRLLPVPSWVLRLGARVLGKRAAVQRLLGSLVVDCAPIQRDLGWRPPYTMAQGLQETAKWFRGLKDAS